MRIIPVQFLTKQTATLKGLNESRVRIYEQIETSLSELEENHNKLTEESAWEKVKIKRWVSVSLHYLMSLLIFSLSVTVETLENRCDELQKHLEEAETRMRNRKEKRRSQRGSRQCVFRSFSRVLEFCIWRITIQQI